MKIFYDEYKTEILFLLGLTATLVTAYGLPDKYGELEQYWFVPALLTLAIYAARQHVVKRKLGIRRVRRSHGDLNFRRVLERAASTYSYLGMGAEEFLRDVNIEKYFTDRHLSGRGVETVRFLFLHPDSPYFEARLREVHHDAELPGVVLAKRGFLTSLHLCLDALPKQVLPNWELRYYAEKPIWLIQLADDAKRPGQLTDALVAVHLPSVHSKHSNTYSLREARDNHIFAGIAGEFEALWLQAAPATKPGEFPPLPSREADKPPPAVS